MDILVTGANGFIGRHVVTEARKHSYAVRAMIRPGTTPVDALKEAEIAEWDLCMPGIPESILKGIDAVVHCAAAMGGNIDVQRAISVDGARTLLEAMKRVGTRRIVHLSTLALYDYRQVTEGAELTEESPLESDFAHRAPYVQAKFEQERMVRTHAADRGWACTILRPGLVFGPSRTWFHHLGVRLSESAWLCLAGDALLPTVYVENCAAAIVRALEVEAEEPVVLNIVDDELPQRRVYVHRLAAEAKPTPRVTNVPWPVLDCASRMTAAIDRMLFRGRLPLPDILSPPSLQARCKPLLYPNTSAQTHLGAYARWGFDEAMNRSLSATEE